MTLPSPSQPKRALALDALRGLAILLMVFSGRIPFGVLPDWMYHAQVPPPEHEFNPNLPGVTWVDLVFPFFLFSMGAAIPLAFTLRMEADGARWKIILSVFSRGVLLAAFAIYVMHIRPWLMNPNPDPAIWVVRLLGFLLLFPMYARFPTLWSNGVRWSVFLLMLGFVFEPYEGGIKKDHATMSYYFITGGLAIMLLIAFTIAIDIFKKQRWFSLLITSGQNPLVAYAGINSLVPPVLGLLGLDAIINNLTPTPWLGVLRGALMTYLVALAASVCTKKRIFLKT
jgi:predicted acyltransferase